MIEVSVRNIKSMNNLSGENLRRALVANLSVTVQGSADRGLVAQLYAVLLRDDGTSEGFASKDMVLRGKVMIPGGMFVPGDMFFPEGMAVPGDMFIPGSMFYPKDGRSDAVVAAAKGAMTSEAAKGGWFFVGIAKEDEIAASGTFLKSI